MWGYKIKKTDRKNPSVFYPNLYVVFIVLVYRGKARKKSMGI